MAKKNWFERLKPNRLGDEVLRIHRRSTRRMRGTPHWLHRIFVKLRLLKKKFVKQMTETPLMEDDDFIIPHKRRPKSKIPLFIRRIFSRRK